MNVVGSRITGHTFLLRASPCVCCVIIHQCFHRRMCAITNAITHRKVTPHGGLDRRVHVFVLASQEITGVRLVQGIGD